MVQMKQSYERASKNLIYMIKIEHNIYTKSAVLIMQMNLLDIKGLNVPFVSHETVSSLESIPDCGVAHLVVFFTGGLIVLNIHNEYKIQIKLCFNDR